MINQLFLTKFESNLTAFITFLAMNSLLLLVMLAEMLDGSPIKTDSGLFFAAISLWLTAFCLVAGGIVLLRHNRERHSRLYAQLPVTSLEVRVAHWCHATLYICIASLALLLILSFAGVFSWFEKLRFTLVFFLHAGAGLAAISIVTGNSLPLVPEELRRRTILYFFVCTMITTLFLGGLGLMVGGYISILEAESVNWTLLTVALMVVCGGLTSLDIYLFTKKQSYLG
jgi:MFS family permease